MSEQRDLTKGLCIYHGGCTDGVAAAWAVWSRFPEWQFYPGVYQQEPPWELIDAVQDVWLVDFSYKRAVIEKMAERARVHVLDHHRTARDDLAPLFEADVIHGKFDMERCGAMLAWDWFHYGSPRPALLEHIDARDRWITPRPRDNDPIVMALRSHWHAVGAGAAPDWPALMQRWSLLMRAAQLSKLATEGYAILRYFRQRVEETKPHATTMSLGPLEDVPVVNAPYYLASEVAGELAADSPSGIAAVWWANKDGSVTFSLRSRGEFDVGELATQYGGGGHPGAAGFRMGPPIHGLPPDPEAECPEAP